MVNIPSWVQDTYYRYKMPKLQIKIEGRGNGIKTLLVNLSDIASSLDRPADYLIKYFGTELGAQSLIDKGGNRYIITGKHDLDELCNRLDKFIETFVLCKKCKNPETIIKIKKQDMYLKCKACGAGSITDPTHKTTSYIIKNYKINKSKNNLVANTDNKNINDNEDWLLDTSQKAVQERRLHYTNTVSLNIIQSKENPIPTLKKYFNTNPQMDIVKKDITDLCKRLKWNNKKLIKILFGTLFGDNIHNNFFKKIYYLKLFVENDNDQKYILECIGMLCSMNKDTIKIINDILYSFWYSDTLSTSVILNWYNNNNTNKDLLDSNINQFIDWLNKD